MNALKNILENLKEQIKTAWAEQQESAFFLSLKERFESLPTVGQKSIKIGSVVLLVALIFWWPLSNFFQSTDLGATFIERRDTLKELLRIERDLASQPQLSPPPPPSSLKTQFDGKIAAAGIKPDQVKEAAEMPLQMIGGAEQKGFQYRITKLTLRQTVDLSYELEHTDPNFKLAGLELIAEPQDLHFYDVGIRIVSYSPKIAELSVPGKSILDAVKAKGGSSSPSNTPPPPALDKGG